jgi:hypothetical protein
MKHDNGGWIGVDLDGTLAEYTGWLGPDHIGRPIRRMVERVQAWLVAGREVRIFTARIAGDEAFGPNIRDTIEKWCFLHIGKVLPITNVKDYRMVELWDDRAVQVKINTGERVGDHDPHPWRADWSVAK